MLRQEAANPRTKLQTPNNFQSLSSLAEKLPSMTTVLSNRLPTQLLCFVAGLPLGPQSQLESGMDLRSTMLQLFDIHRRQDGRDLILI